MVRIAGESSRKTAKHVRYDDIPMDTFTPRTYQVELLESALHGNTIACLGSDSSKIFLGLMVIREMSHQIRCSMQDGGKRSIYLAESDEQVPGLWSTLYHHTDFGVGKTTLADSGLWLQSDWMTFLDTNNILVLSASLFLQCLEHNYLSLSDLNLLVLDDCHLTVDNHPYVKIVECVVRCEVPPQLLCLTASILGNDCSNPAELASRITNLESLLHSKAETSMLVISERFGCRPKERVVECEADEDVTGLKNELANILMNAWLFLDDCQVTLDESKGKKDPLHVPKFAISECINILQFLGPWCGASIAENLLEQLDKIVKHESDPMQKRYVRYAMTQLRLVIKVFEINFMPNYCIDELLKYTTPKVRALVDILRNYKPEMDFMIISSEGAEGEGVFDISDDGSDYDDDDSLNLSDSDEDDSRSDKQPKQIHIAVKRKVETNNDNPFNEEKKLCGLVFVDNRYVAFALNKMIEEICSWDENLCFVKSSHITGQGIHRPDGRTDLSKASRRQEDVLRKFRMQERNLLISTNVLEEGVDIPKCNLVVRFDPPTDYRSYTLSKGRARSRDAEYVILIDDGISENFPDDLQVFKGIEQVLIGAGRGRKDLEDALEVPEMEKLDFTPLPSFCPSGLPGAPSVSMKTAIALINRYCAKLPSDAFTHLTPHCKVCPTPSDPQFYVAYLRLPVNSPIKEEVMGVPMPSRQLAKMAVALQMCQMLYKAGELDKQLQPVGKEMFVMEEEEEWEDEEDEALGQARPGTTKRKQYYIKKQADAFVNSRPRKDEECYLYQVSMELTGPITEEQNTRGRKIYAPEETPQCFGILLSKEIPRVPSFPVYTRSGEVTVFIELLRKSTYTGIELKKLQGFHHFVFCSVLHLEKDPMVFSPEEADIGLIVVPLNLNKDGVLDIEWAYVELVDTTSVHYKPNVFDSQRAIFEFEKEKFEDAVVMPSYRNIDQPQHFYVAEIRSDLSPLSPFPSPELYKTFAAYYTTKYGLALTNMDQPLLDVDHTSARLNLLTPRYMNQKGRALPTSSMETKRARRENLQQKQILVPELCAIHVFPASLWRKAVCLPAILYRMNYLLLAEELRKLIAGETGIGQVNLGPEFRFPRLNFGFETNPEKLQESVVKENQRVFEVQSEDKNEDKIEVIVPNLPVQPQTFDLLGNDQVLVPESSDSKEDSEKLDAEDSSDSDSGVASNESETGCIESSDGKEVFPPLKLFGDFVQTQTLLPWQDEAPFCDSYIIHKNCKFPYVKEMSVVEDMSDASKISQQSLLLKNSSSLNVEENSMSMNESQDVLACKKLKMFHNSTEVLDYCEKPERNSFASPDLSDSCDFVQAHIKGSFSPNLTDSFNKNWTRSNCIHSDVHKDSEEQNSSKQFDISPHFDAGSRCEKQGDYPTIKDCDDFLDVTGTNKPLNLSSALPVDPEISHFTKPEDEVKLTFGSVDQLRSTDLDRNWSRVSAHVSKKEWAPNENLTTFEVSGHVPDLENYGVNGKTDPVFSFEQTLNEEHTTSDLDATGQCASKDSLTTHEQSDCSAGCMIHQGSSGSIELVPVDKPDLNLCLDSPPECITKKWSDSTNVPDQEAQSAEHNSLNYGTLTANTTGVSTVYCSSGSAPAPRNLSTQNFCGSSSSESVKAVESIRNISGNSVCELSVPSVSLALQTSNEIKNLKVSNCKLVHSTGKVAASSGDELCIPEVGISLEKVQISSVSNGPAFQMPTTCSLQKKSAQEFVSKETLSTDDRFTIGMWNIPKDRIKPTSSTFDLQKENLGSCNDETLKITFSLDADPNQDNFVGPSPCLLLQALTMSNANDFFSLERLETIGDSFLKYAITVYLYCCYPGTHEGKLSYLRSKQVSNYNLYRLGRRKGLAERMVSTKFEPYENWLPPGYIISEDRRRGPVPKVVIATANPKLSANASVNFFIEDEESGDEGGSLKRETQAFNQELEEIDRQQAVDEQNDISHSTKRAMIPYSLQLHHGIPDKSVADCVEALIGCYLTTCGKQAALTFMSWLGLKVLPRKRTPRQKDRKAGQEVNVYEFDELRCPPSPLIGTVPKATDILNRLLEGFSEFEAKINYTFRDRSYLLQAFTHASYHYNYITDCYQRLEFLGDAILDYVITRHLYEDSQRYSPGILTDLRSALVNNNIFAALAVKWDFHKYFKAISPSLFAVIDMFVVRQKDREDVFDETEEEEEADCEEDDEDSDKEEEVELEIPKALGDIFESVAGAIYLDSGMSLDTVWRVYYRMMKPHIDKYLKDIPKSPVRELLEMEPETAKFEKPERTLEGKIRVTVNVVGKGVFSGVGRNYRIAKSAAAKKALRTIRSLQQEGLS